MFDLVIFGGTIVDHDKLLKGTIAVRKGKIAAVTEPGVDLAAQEVIDATEKYIFPGGIDCHVHFNEPGFEWREDYAHGTRSAAAGGITTVIDMPLQNTPAVTSAKVFKRKEELLAHKGVVDFAFWGGLVDNNVDELLGLYESGAVALKAFIGPVSPDYSSVHSGIIRHAMQKLQGYDILFGFHAEDYSIVTYEESRAIEEGRVTIEDYLSARPVIAELQATENVIRLAEGTGARVHICHVSHPDVAQKIKEAQLKGVRITGETCSHYLIFTKDDFIEKGPIFKCAPPLREEADKEKLWKYVLDGTLSCVGSDHSPCTLQEKVQGNDDIWKAWGGISGVQSTFQVMFDAIVHRKKLEPTILANVLAYGPAKTFDLYPQKGVLVPGSDADMVILDPELSWEITSDSLFYKNKISAFTGLKGKGVIEKTIVRGQVVFTEGVIRVQDGYGKLVKPVREFVKKEGYIG